MSLNQKFVKFTNSESVKSNSDIFRLKKRGTVKMNVYWRIDFRMIFNSLFSSQLTPYATAQNQNHIATEGSISNQIVISINIRYQGGCSQWQEITLLRCEKNNLILFSFGIVRECFDNLAFLITLAFFYAK